LLSEWVRRVNLKPAGSAGALPSMVNEAYTDGDLETALEAYDQAIELDPNISDFHFKRAL
jgi:hypothetical protein